MIVVILKTVITVLKITIEINLNIKYQGKKENNNNMIYFANGEEEVYTVANQNYVNPYLNLTENVF